MNDFYAPATISIEAKDALREYSRTERNQSLPQPNDITGWKKLQAQLEQDFAPDSKAVIKQYSPKIIQRKLGGIPVLDIKPRNWKQSKNILVYTHGGAYTLFSAFSTLNGTVPIADETGLQIISVDYTVAPQAKWDEITDQVISVLQALIQEGHPLENIAIYGDSAGGGLASGAVLKMRDKGLGMPKAVVLWSPWSDITEIGDTYHTLQDKDPVLYYPNNLANAALAYAKKADQKNPYVSPVYGDYSKGFPPTLIQAGTKEIFLSNAIRQYHALDDAGIEVKLDPYEGMWHVFQALRWNLPESKRARAKVKTFLEKHIGQ